jgi:hypothetical protein
MVTYFEERTEITSACKQVFMKMLCPEEDAMGIEDVTE